ncbi:MAG: hypothetical protein KatS3mg059_1081 [Thermomicrobiales bacterium]|nr:MAG: hypothetical protein KatS3mg059_1081 [Thermomicrobiales bacterium]
MAPLPDEDTFGTGATFLKRAHRCPSLKIAPCAANGGQQAEPASPRGDAAGAWSNPSNGQGAEGSCPQLLRIVKYTAEGGACK